MKKKKIMVLFGGNSTEHQVSLIAAKSVMENMDKSLYEVIPVGITKDGSWYLMPETGFLTDDRTVENASLKLKAGKPLGINLINKRFFTLDRPNDTFAPDSILPVLHGTIGDDDSVRGLAQILDIGLIANL